MLLRTLTLSAGAFAFAGILATGAWGAAAVHTTTTHSEVHTGASSDESEDNPDVAPDTEDMDAAEAEIRRQMHDARMQIIRRGGNLVVSMGSDILFTFDSYEVTNEGTAAAKVLAQVLVRHRKSTVEVNGYTDTRGTPAYNQTLSENRANAVAEILEANGVPQARITTHGFGETSLAVQTPDETKEIKNRRVEIVIHPGRRGLGHVKGHGRRNRPNHQ